MAMSCGSMYVRSRSKPPPINLLLRPPTSLRAPFVSPMYPMYMRMAIRTKYTTNCVISVSLKGIVPGKNRATSIAIAHARRIESNTYHLIFPAIYSSVQLDSNILKMSSITKKTWRSSLRYNSYVSSSSNRKYSINISAAHAIRAQITTTLYQTDSRKDPEQQGFLGFSRFSILENRSDRIIPPGSFSNGTSTINSWVFPFLSFRSISCAKESRLGS
mmetsp:Transcript_30146/g.48323  ORF Transcript_30146/g.48323 Transcript_30146/m.48323 type:complete len:217 (-) Transcript_30146:33-683(-)